MTGATPVDLVPTSFRSVPRSEKPVPRPATHPRPSPSPAAMSPFDMSQPKAKAWKKGWAEEEMQAAVALLRQRDARESVRAVARRFGLDHSTLLRRMREEKPTQPQPAHKLPHRPGPPTQLSVEAEQRILKEMREIQEGGFLTGAITNARIAQIAFEQSKATRAPLAGPPSLSWVRGFKKRHAAALGRGNINHLTLTRARGTQAQLDAWRARFEAKLEELFGKKWSTNKSLPARLWNADETGFASLEQKQPRTITVRGACNPRHHALSVSLQAHLSVVLAISASGASMPPFAITVGKEARSAWARKAPAGTQFAVSAKASMERALFKDFIQHFLDSLPANYSTAAPTLLLIDNHSSRASPEALQLAKEHNVHVFGLLSNSSHFLQPCDRYVFANYKRKFHAAAFSWLRRNGHSVVPKTAFGELLWEAQTALTEEAIQRSWASAGLCPLNEDLLAAHPSVLRAPVRSSSAPAALGTAASALASSSVVFGRNGQLRSSGVDLTSAEVIHALTEREQAKELKEQRKKRKAEERALRAAAAEPAAKRPKRSAPLRPWTPEPEGDEEKENVPPAPVPAQTAADPVVAAVVPAPSPALPPFARMAPPSLSLVPPPVIYPAILFR